MKKVDFSKIGYQIWEKKVQILVTVFLFFLLSIAYTLNFTVPFYQSTIMLEVADKNSGRVDEKRMATYCEILKSEIMLEETIQNLALDLEVQELQKDISVKQVPESTFLQITVNQENPQDATRIANELAEGFQKKAQETYHIQQIAIPEEATIPERAYYMLPIQDILLFCLAGIVLSIGYMGITSIVEQRKEIEQAQKKKREEIKQKKEGQEKAEKIQSNQEKGEKNEAKPKRGRKKNS